MYLEICVLFAFCVTVMSIVVFVWLVGMFVHSLFLPEGHVCDEEMGECDETSTAYIFQQDFECVSI